MPYGIKMQGSRHCVVKSATGAVVKCHPTHGQALAHQRALMANVTAREYAAYTRQMVEIEQENVWKLQEETHALDEG